MNALNWRTSERSIRVRQVFPAVGGRACKKRKFVVIHFGNAERNRKIFKVYMSEGGFEIGARRCMPSVGYCGM